MQHRMMTPDAVMTSRALSGLPELARIQAKRAQSWRVTFALAAVAFAVSFGVVAFVL